MKVYRLADGRWARDAGDELLILDGAPWLGGRETSVRAPKSHLAAPVAPSKIVCIGRNYAAHAAELGNRIPAAPLLFLKPPSAIIGPEQPIRLPEESALVEHEGELAVVVGQRLVDADEASARDGIFGFTAANDVTARDLQRADVQFTRGKGFDTFCPVGPCVVTGLDTAALTIRTWVGSTLRQDGHTSAMLWPPAALLAYISRVMTLEPGDLVLTGTPAGVGPLEPGNTVRVEIQGIEPLVNPVARRHAERRVLL